MDIDFEPLIEELDEHGDTPRSAIRSGHGRPRTMADENLKFLSKFQSPHLNKLLSALASDSPLHTEHVRRSPVPTKRRGNNRQQIGVNAQESSNLQVACDSSSQLNISTEVSVREVCASEFRKSYKRDIQCATHSRESEAHEPQTSPPLSSCLALFSPSMFESDTPDLKRRRVFTFDANHISESSGRTNPTHHHSTETRMDIRNRPPPISTLLSPGRANLATRTPLGAMSLQTSGPGLRPCTTHPSMPPFSPTRIGLTPRSPHPSLMDDKDFAELYDVAKEAGFFAETPRHDDHRYSLPPGDGRASVETPLGHGGGTPPHGTTPSRHVHFMDSGHEAPSYSLFYPTGLCDDESSPGSPAPGGGDSHDLRFGSVPPISELDKVLRQTHSAYAPLQSAAVISVPTAHPLEETSDHVGAARKRERMQVQNPLEEMGLSSQVDANGILMQQQPHCPLSMQPGSINNNNSSSRSISSDSGGNSGSDAGGTLPSIVSYIRSSFPAVPASFSPRRVKNHAPNVLAVEAAGGSVCGSSNAAVSNASNALVETKDPPAPLATDNLEGLSSDGQMSLARLCTHIVKDCKEREVGGTTHRWCGVSEHV